jgi:hypothetical protein
MRFLFLFCALLSGPIFAEDSPGSAAQVVREVHLKKDPSDDAPSLGRLPKGTILTLRGDRRNGFAEVSVELETGSIDGWVRIDSLNKRARGEDVDDGSSERIRIQEGEEEVDVPRPRSRIAIPKDEGLLLRRDSSFFYGVQVGGAFAITQSASTDYFGIGLVGGAHLGFYIDRNLPMRVEVSYLQQNGAAQDGTFIDLGFIDTALSASYVIDRVELFGAIGYAYGISTSDIADTSVTFESPSDLSTVFAGGGVGYAFPIGEVTDLAIRARYMFGFLQTPVAFQSITLQFYFQFRG